MERPADDPTSWNLLLETADPVTTIEMILRDIVEPVEGIPIHQGLEISVDLDAQTLDDAVTDARRTTETTSALLAAAARAPVGSTQTLLAYEITPGAGERAFAQWFPDVPIPQGKQSVPQDVFGALWAEIPRLPDERVLSRLMLSMSWHRLALEEVGSIRRFVMLWISFEALGPLLAESFSVPPSGFGGLRALAESAGESETLVSDALGLRREMFHALRVRGAELEARAGQINPRLEDLAVAAWVRVLGIENLASSFPEAATTAHPIQVVVRTTLRHDDESVWGAGSHPHFSGTVEVRRVASADPRSVSLNFTHTLTLRNADEVRGALRIEVWGPSGPAAPAWGEPPRITDPGT